MLEFQGNFSVRRRGSGAGFHERKFCAGRGRQCEAVPCAVRQCGTVPCAVRPGKRKYRKRKGALADFCAGGHWLFGSQQCESSLRVLRAQQHSLRENPRQFCRL